MNRAILITLYLINTTFALGQAMQEIAVGKAYPPVEIGKNQQLVYSLKLEKGITYEIAVMQQGIDVKLIFTDQFDKLILEKDSPNGENGYEKFEFTPNETKSSKLKIVRLEEVGNSEGGKITISLRRVSKEEIQIREKIRKELAPENQKTVQTLDIDHFWQAFDNLKNCKTRNDSIRAFQTIYLDKATDGLLDFIVARDFTAEKFVNQISRFPKFYASVRTNTLEAKKAAPLVEEVVSRFKEIYPNFKAYKVCFAIGLVNTGGTISDKFLLIGTEVSASTGSVDLSEFNNSAYSKQLASGGNVAQKIKDIVAHEYVHTQQKTPFDKNSIDCPLLYMCMREGFCDFVGELASGSRLNSVSADYGNQHEKQLWKEFKGELCNSHEKNWLYNYSTVKDRPADLGYYIGYKIAEEYYQNAADKKQAVIDIIEMNDPIKFLQLSKYDQKLSN